MDREHLERERLGTEVPGPRVVVTHQNYLGTAAVSLFKKQKIKN